MNLMKKVNVYLLLFFFLAAFAQARLEGRKYIDDKFKFEIRVPNDWKINTTSRKKHIIMVRDDNVSEVSVDVFPLESHQNTARIVATDHIIDYDGWEYIAGRRLGWLEKRGASSGFCVMYNKSMLSSRGGKNKVIVQEYYFIKNQYSYIVTLVTDNELWYEVKDDLLGALASFKIY